MPRPLTVFVWTFAAISWLPVGRAAPAPAPATEPRDGNFAIPQPGRTFEFPRDHAAHPEFKLEWWYVTGHLFTETVPARRFGFQATFFRQASPDRTTEVHLAHMAVTDLAGGRFLHQERLNRTGSDAAISTENLDLRQGPWSLTLLDPATETMRLQGGIAAEAAFTLELRPEKPLVVFGENGVSSKGREPWAASHYLTFTRLAAVGELSLGTDRWKVRGQAWMDHEFSSSQLGEGQIGWDWVSVQLTDGREAMLYRLRLRDGSADPASTFTWIDRAGRPQRIPYRWTVLETWTSPRTGATYPARVQIEAEVPGTGESVTLRVEPLFPAQEWPGEISGIPYWEGACRVTDAEGREIGSAFMELTGYARDLKL